MNFVCLSVTLQRQMAVTAFLRSQQLLLFAFVMADFCLFVSDLIYGMCCDRLVESSHSQTVTVVGHQPPEFTKLFNDMRVRPGESCKMDVTITGMPKPKVISSIHIQLYPQSEKGIKQN